jgi:flagellar basal-body rod modification protein FlgD
LVNNYPKEILVTTIQTTTAATAATAATTAAAAIAATQTNPNEASDRFLKLLVTQLRNQDPLSPMDNAQITTQLAQISTVSGINKLNDTLTALAASQGAAQTLQAAGIIGHNVLVPGNQLQLDGGTAAGGLTLAQSADRIVVTISDASGRTVRELDLGAASSGTHTFTWDGITDGGAVAADGVYTINVAATAGGNAIFADPLASGKVFGLYPGKDGTLLDLGRLGRIDMANVIEIN